MDKKFSKGEAIRFGWEGMKKNFWLWAGVMLLIFVLSSISSSANNNMKNTPIIAAVVMILVFAIDVIIQMGIVRATLKIADGAKPTIDDIFSERKLFWRYLGASVLYGLMVVGGLILLIVPGIIWAVKYQFSRYLIVDKQLGIMDSFKQSGVITTGIKSQLFLFDILLFGIILAGAIAFGVGLIAAVPTAFIATVFVYRKFSSATV